MSNKQQPKQTGGGPPKGGGKKVKFENDADNERQERSNLGEDTKHGDADEAEGLWFNEAERWELTWPIWHMLSREERRTIAHKHGYHTIGEFEEYMTMQRAMGDSTERQKPYENSLIYPTEQKRAGATTDTVKPRVTERDEEDDNSTDLDEKLESEQLAAADKLPTAELIAMGGQILMLPDELLHRVFDFLPVDFYAVLALVSPHWKSFTRTEAVYKRLCERLYLQQSKRRALHVSRFGNSYRTMLEKRPRVRAGGGVYVIKYSKVRAIQRDMWTEIPRGAVLEMVYYRYLYFQEDGSVLYALTTSDPHDMFRRLRNVNLKHNKSKEKFGVTEDPAAVWGRYQVSGHRVTVTARQSWQYVKLELTIRHISIYGRYGYLSLDRHVTSSSKDFPEWDNSTVEFAVPDEPFRFIKDRRL